MVCYFGCVQIIPAVCRLDGGFLGERGVGKGAHYSLVPSGEGSRWLGFGGRLDAIFGSLAERN